MIQNGSTVRIHYTLRVDDEVVDSSAGRDPLTYVQGQGQIVRGLEEQLEGAAAGQKKQITVSPDKGYGERDEEAVHQVPKEAFRAPENLSVGDVVAGRVGENSFRATVRAVETEHVTLDLNHPLAGKTLTFEVEVVEVS